MFSVWVWAWRPETSENPPTIKPYMHVASHIVPADSPIAVEAAQAAKIAFGDAVVRGFASGCDARIMFNEGGVPSIVMGPGYLEQAHSADEFLVIDEFLKAVRAYAVLICRWCGVA